MRSQGALFLFLFAFTESITEEEGDSGRQKKSELQSKHYNEQGEEIIQWANVHRLPFIKDMMHGITEQDYRDEIHLNPQGQKKLAAIMKKVILNRL